MPIALNLITYGVPFSGSSLSALSVSYRQRVEDVGGSVSDSAIALIDEFFNSASATLLQKTKLFYRPMTSSFTGAHIPLIGDNTTIYSYTSGDWSISGGFTGDGSTQRVDSDEALLAADTDLLNNISLGVWVKQVDISGGNQTLVSQRFGTNPKINVIPGSQQFFDCYTAIVNTGRATQIPIVSAPSNQLLMGNRRSSTDSELILDGSVIATATNEETTTPNATRWFEWGENTNTWTGVFIGQGLTTEEATELNNLWKDLEAGAALL
ncbi:MAG: hypothetical protein AAGA75_25550 [Cyanobacteria bacterium P01_E01_bin.6]